MEHLSIHVSRELHQWMKGLAKGNQRTLVAEYAAFFAQMGQGDSTYPEKPKIRVKPMVKSAST